MDSVIAFAAAGLPRPEEGCALRPESSEDRKKICAVAPPAGHSCTMDADLDDLLATLSSEQADQKVAELVKRMGEQMYVEMRLERRTIETYVLQEAAAGTTKPE